MCRTRSWYAAIVQGLIDLPESLQELLENNPSGSLIVKRYYYNDYKIIKPGKLEILGENRVDRTRAAVSTDIGIGYDIALAALNGDI